MVGGNAEERLPTATRERLDALLRPKKSVGEENAVDDAQGEAAGGAPAVLLTLRGSPGRPSLASMQDELAKLELILGVDLPADLFEQASPRDLVRYRRGAAPRDQRGAERG